MQKYKIVILGEGGVGKTAITLRYIVGKFIKKYDPTIQDNYVRQIELENEICMIEIQDTAGQDEYASLTDQFTQIGDAFIIVYSITSERSFSRAKDYWQKIRRSREISIHSKPIAVLVGSKTDLEDERKVSRQEAMRFASENKLEFCEVSAKQNNNISKVFFMAAKLARDRIPEKKKPRRCQIL